MKVWVVFLNILLLFQSFECIRVRFSNNILVWHLSWTVRRAWDEFVVWGNHASVTCCYCFVINYFQNNYVSQCVQIIIGKNIMFSFIHMCVILCCKPKPHLALTIDPPENKHFFLSPKNTFYHLLFLCCIFKISKIVHITYHVF